MMVMVAVVAVVVVVVLVAMVAAMVTAAVVTVGIRRCGSLTHRARSGSTPRLGLCQIHPYRHAGRRRERAPAVVAVVRGRQRVVGMSVEDR